MNATDEARGMAALEEPELIREIRQGDLMMRLVRVARALGPVLRTGHNRAQNYDYATAETMLSDVRAPLLEENVLVLAYEHHTDERMRQTAQGGESYVTTVHLVFLLVAADTGERIELMWPGRGDDPMDKGIGKALTNAIKTFLRQQFLLPWGDDPEADEGTDQRAGQSATVNLAGLVAGSGLNDTKLNEILVGAGLQAVQKPFTSFTRIPAEKGDIVAKLIAGAKS